MAVDVKKLIAAINPDIYCKNELHEESGKKLNQLVKEIAKKEGFLKASETAELKISDYLDIPFTQFTKSAFSLPGFNAPTEQHKLVYDDFSQNLEPIYFWILDYVDSTYGKSEKLIDNFISSPGGGHFAEIQARATRMQDEAMKIFGTANTVIRSILNLIYDLKEWKLKLSAYDDYHSEDKKKKMASLLSLKQTWMDNVDVKRGVGSINGLAQQLDFVTIRDAFMTANSLDNVANLDLNDRVKRILQQRVSEFFAWIKESEKALRTRFEIEKTYLKSQVNSLRLYSRWLKPYLKAARHLEQNATSSAAVVNAFNTTIFELVLLAIGKYDMNFDIEKGELPKSMKKMKLRKYSPVTIIEFSFRSSPDRADQRGGYGFRGRAEITFSSFALNDDELTVLREQINKDDFGDVFKMIEGATDESLGELRDDLDELLGDSNKNDAEKNELDINPFSALFSFFKSGKEKEKDLSKEISKDNYYEKVIRSQAILSARQSCRKLYDAYKKVHGMPAFPPVIE